MGRYTTVLQTIIQRKLDKKMSRVEAFRKVRKSNHRSIAEWHEHIDSIYERFDNAPPDEWNQAIMSVSASIDAEEQLLKDLNELEATPWATTQ